MDPGGAAITIRLMRVALSAFVALLAAAACAPSAPTATEPMAPTVPPPAIAIQTPTPTERLEWPDPTSQPIATPPQARPVAWDIPPSATFPLVKLARGPITITTPSPLVSVIASHTWEQQHLEQWSRDYAQLLNHVAAIGRSPETEQQLAWWHVGGAYLSVVRTWVYGGPPSRTFESRDLTVERVYAKPWGRLALVEARMRLWMHGAGGAEESRTLHLRLVLHGQSSWQILDGFAEPAARWPSGDAVRFTAQMLETELPGTVASYLWTESFTPGGEHLAPVGRENTHFGALRAAALDELNARFRAGTLLDRHFEDVSLRIVRFDPATFLGDGVVTVRLDGTLVEYDGKGARLAERFSQQLKFLRVPDMSGAAYYAVDAQEADGSWDSGGDLGLGVVDHVHG
jgi:hypothetical protein